MSNFAFLKEWPEILDNARQVEGMVHGNPRAACFYCRYTLERTVKWMYRHDDYLQLPAYDNQLNTLIYQPPFTDLHVDGLHAFFNDEQVDAIINRLLNISETATAEAV